MATVTFESVWKRYGEVVAVRDFNLEIRDAEFMVLVGPSGCGKTTSLRMIAGLEEISDGTLRIGERVVNDVAAKDRDIAMVFQSYALYPHMTVRDNMAFGLKLRKIPKADIEKRVGEAAQILDLGGLLERKPKELSGGQRQRVALGRAIVREPAVFLMDEPLSNLDAKLRVQTRAEIARLHQRLQTTIVYVTHDQVEAMTMGSRIAVMSAGDLQQVGTPQELYDRPANLFVAGFMGSPSMSFLPGTLEGGRLRTPLGEVELPGEVSASAGREVIAGIRPEHFEEAAVAGERPGGRARVSIDVVEPVGSDVFAYFTVPGEPPPAVGLSGLMADGEGGQDGIQVAARLGAGSRVREGESVELWYDAARVHLFDEESGDRLEA
jgi:multiple sugar transport system ATP-binding protein